MLRTMSIALLLTASLGIAVADAHPRLEISNPAGGAVLKTPPKEIRMHFSEALIPIFTGLELKDTHGKSMPTGKGALAGGDDRTLVVPLGTRLAPGAYTVVWHAVSVDTHRVSGSYAFRIAR